MKGKKIISAALAGVMALSLTACGGGSTQETTAAPAADSKAEETTAAAEGSEAATGEGVAKEDLKVGFIFIGDENEGYTAAHYKGAKEMQEALGLNDDQLIVKWNIPEDETAKDAAMDLADQGCQIVFANSFGHESYMIQAAKDFPNVQFCHSTGTRAHTEGLSNYHNAFASIYEGRYLAGIAAGMKMNEMIAAGKFTEAEAKMGYVGAFTYAEVVSGYTSFYLGAKSVCPSVTMDVTFTGSWYDETLEKEGAQKLIAGGCKLISQHADSLGAPTACENAGVPNVSYNGSTITAGPNTYIISSRIDWAPYYEMAIKAVMDGTEIPADYTGNLSTGSVVLTDLNTAVAAEGTQAAIDAAKAKLESGELHVFDCSTFTVSGANVKDTMKVDADGHLTSYMADVNTDEAYTGDTEVVHDGYFSESEFRSAPYFDLFIDGINTLDTAF